MTHWREQDIVSKLREMMAEIRSPYVDGFTGSAVKRDLYRIKCFLEDEYPKLPYFTDEPQYEQERLMEILTKK